MKKKVLIVLLGFILLGCSENTNHKNTENMKYQNFPLEKQLTYMLDVSSKIPIIIYFNDIKISEENTPVNTAVDVNPYVLKNGKYKVKVQIFPTFRSGDSFISPEEIKSCRISFGHYIRDKKNDDILNYDSGVPLSLNVPHKPVPYFEQEWEVEITELPYELEGWSKGQDLRKWDQKVLEKKVVDYYQKLWKTLNNGEGKKYISLWSKADEELVKYDYEYNIENINAEEAETIAQYCKGMMIPLEDFEMKIYAEGKLVSLERKNHTRDFNNESPLDLKGWSSLIRKGKISGAEEYPIKLYLPEGSDEFVIIRK